MSKLFKIMDDFNISKNNSCKTFSFSASTNYIINQHETAIVIDEFYRTLVAHVLAFFFRMVTINNFFPAAAHTTPTRKESEYAVEHDFYQTKMDHAKNFEDWHHAASKLDQLEGRSEWTNNPQSDDYDWELIQTRMNEISKIRKTENDRKSMIFTLKLGLSRNLGDMGNATLYTKTRVGTKKLISDYTDGVIDQLNWIGDIQDNSGDLSLKEKHDYFMNLRRSYGRTALLLSGGGTLGFFHIGVLKAMVNARLLPRIISGASTGSIMSAIICTLNEQDRIKVLNSPWSIPLEVFENPESPETLLLRLRRYLMEGNLYDPNRLKDVLTGYFGNITFQEAYNRSRLILNVTISSSSIFEMPQLLNYITAPDVVICSAVLASCSVPLIYPDQEIYMKNKAGELIPWTSTVDKYRDGSVDNDLPLKRISELFSVNHFVVVQINPHIAPFLHKKHSDASLWRRGVNFGLRMLREEILHRCSQLKELGIRSNGIIRMENVLSQRYLGDITLAPELLFNDVKKILSNPDLAFATKFIQNGERTTWQKMSKIKHSLKIELAIDAAIYKIRAKLLGESPQIPIEQPLLNMILGPSNSSSLLFLKSTYQQSFSSSTSGSQSPSSSVFQSTTVSDDEAEEEDSSTTGYYQYTNSKKVPLSSSPLLPPTPLWKMDEFIMQRSTGTSSSFLLHSPSVAANNNSTRRPSLLPHDISRRGSNVSIRDISPTTSSTNTSRRKQVTSAQFFISPEFEWLPNTPVQDFKKSVVVAVVPPAAATTTEIQQQQKPPPASHNKNNLSIVIRPPKLL